MLFVARFFKILDMIKLLKEPPLWNINPNPTLNPPGMVCVFLSSSLNCASLMWILTVRKSSARWNRLPNKTPPHGWRSSPNSV